MLTNARIWKKSSSSTESELRNIHVSGGKIKDIHPSDPKKGLPEGLPLIDAAGGLVTPPYADPHVHLDAVLLGNSWPNQSGTLVEGIANWAKAKETLTSDEIIKRAHEAVKWMVASGTTRIRTHADTGCPAGVEALLELRHTAATADLADIQIVAFPQDGILTAPQHQKDLIWAANNGVDAVGGIPHIERTYDEGSESMRIVFDLAEQKGLKVDVHCDETDDPNSRHIETVAALTVDRSMGGMVVAGHCTAMHSYSNPAANKAITAISRSGVQIVANPLDNIVLQGRFDTYPKRRGLTRIPELIKAGAFVGVGHDSVVDPWYPLGTGNMLDAAYMLVHACHLSGQSEMARVFEMLVHDNHLPFGGAPKIETGETAEFLVHSLSDPIDLIRTRRLPRFVVRSGKVIAENATPETTVQGETVKVGMLP